MLTRCPPRPASDRVPSEAAEPFVSLMDVLRQRAELQAEAVAFRFLQNGEDETLALTYAQLDRAARRLAARLQEKGLTGQRVLLLYPTDPAHLMAILGCLYAGVVAVPLNLPRPNRGLSRIRAVVRDAEPSAVLTNGDTVRRLGHELQPILSPSDISLLATDEMEGTTENWVAPELTEASVAYLQYTSGSIAAPKGVAVTQGNLSHNLQALENVVRESGPHVGVGWLPFFHDMGLVGTLFLPLWMGFPHVFMPPEAFIMKPVRWLQAISRYGGTLSPAPNFAYELCVQRVTDRQRKELDLSSWRIAFNGAERINPDSLERFAGSFRECGFRSTASYPCYGLAESTLFVTGGCPEREPVIRRFDRHALAAGGARPHQHGTPHVSCGRPREGLDVILVDPETAQRVDDGRVGEIWISGKSVAAGYWRDDRATAETFHARRADGESGTYLRTGDLGFVHDGELFICGRLKDLIIIGGRNIVPDDVEAAVERAHPEIVPGGAVAFSVDGAPRERLIVVVEVERSTAAAGLAPIGSAVHDATASEHDIAIDELIFVQNRSLPRTANGKKQRAACRQLYLDDAIRRRIDA